MSRCVKRDKDGVVFGYTKLLAEKPGFSVISSAEAEKLNQERADAGPLGPQEEESFDELKARVKRENIEALAKMDPSEPKETDMLDGSPPPEAKNENCFADKTLFPNKAALETYAKRIQIVFEDDTTRKQMEDRLQQTLKEKGEE